MPPCVVNSSGSLAWDDAGFESRFSANSEVSMDSASAEFGEIFSSAFLGNENTLRILPRVPPTWYGREGLLGLFSSRDGCISPVNRQSSLRLRVFR
jgi:hypothetical protein